MSDINSWEEHKGVVEEIRYYLILLEPLLDLPTYETSLDYPFEAEHCLKLKDALRIFYDRYKPGRVDTLVYDYLKEKPSLVADWYATLPDFAGKGVGEIWEAFATEDLSEVSEAAIPGILVRLGYLADAPTY